MAIARISIDEVEEKIIINFDIAEKKKKKSKGANRLYTKCGYLLWYLSFGVLARFFIG